MGVSKDETANRKAATTTSAKSPAYSGSHVATPDTALDWGLVDPALLQRTVGAVTRAGDAVSFARGAHGRWLSCTVLAGGEKYRYPCESVEGCELVLERIEIEAQARTSR